jgi:hypothetical protein
MDERIKNTVVAAQNILKISYEQCPDSNENEKATYLNLMALLQFVLKVEVSPEITLILTNLAVLAVCDAANEVRALRQVVNTVCDMVLNREKEQFKQFLKERGLS